MANIKRNASSITLKEAAEMLGLSQGKVRRYLDALKYPVRKGVWIELTESDVRSLADYHHKRMQERYVETEQIDDQGRVRVNVLAYNQKLNVLVATRRYTYNYLVGTGEWALGVTRIPQGYVIHHIDHTSNNDAFNNLLLLSVAAHARLHWMDDSRRKLMSGVRGPRSEETKKKMSDAHKGSRRTEEQKQRMSEAQKLRYSKIPH